MPAAAVNIACIIPVRADLVASEKLRFITSEKPMIALSGVLNS